MLAWLQPRLSDAPRLKAADLRIIPGMGHKIPDGLVTTVADAITAAAGRAKVR